MTTLIIILLTIMIGIPVFFIVVGLALNAIAIASRSIGFFFVGYVGYKILENLL